jgi:hypothetical protein
MPSVYFLRAFVRTSLLATCLFLASAGQAQQIRLTTPAIHVACAGAIVSVSFTSATPYEAGNNFQIQLAQQGSPTVTLPGSFTASPLSMTLPASAIGRNFSIRVVSSRPVQYSEYSDTFVIMQRPTATLTGSPADGIAVNPYTPVNLSVPLTGIAPYEVRLTDGTRYVITDDMRNLNGFWVSPGQTTTYTLAEVRNNCGTGTVSGTATVAVNSQNVLIPKRLGTNFCMGTWLPVHFSTEEPLPANTPFEAELVGPYDERRTIPLAVRSGADGPLVSLPGNLSATTLQGYRLRVFSRQAGLSAWFEDGDYLTIRKTATLNLTAPANVAPGQTASLTLTTTAATGGGVLLSDGQRLWLPNSGPPAALFSVATVQPTQTTTYSIVAPEFGCMAGDDPVVKATIQVRAGLRIDSLSVSEVCAGNPVTLYFTPVGGYIPPAKLRVRYSTYLLESEGIVTKPGQLVFTPPTAYTTISKSKIALHDPVTDNLVGVKERALSVWRAPNFYFRRETQTLAVPGNATLEGWYHYGGRGIVRLRTGQQFAVVAEEGAGSAEVYMPAYAHQTARFEVDTVYNQCGGYSTRRGGYSASWVGTEVVVQRPAEPKPALAFRPTKTNPCPNELTWLNLFVSGSFEADNEFRLEVANPDGTYSGTALATTKTNRLAFRWPTLNGGRFVRVSSTNPVVQTQGVWFYTHEDQSPATVSLGLEAPSGITSGNAVTVAAGQSVLLRYASAGAEPRTYRLLDGTIETAASGIVRHYQPTISGSYGVAEVVNSCRVSSATALGQRAAVTVLPYLLQTRTIGSLVCTKPPIDVPFGLTGSVPASASYVVQISTDRRAWQSLPTSGTASPLRTQLPAALANQPVYYRVSVLDGSGTLTPGFMAESAIIPNTTPAILLSHPTGQTVVSIEPKTTTQLRLKDQNAEAWNALARVQLTNGTQVFNIPVYREGSLTSISTPGTYSILSSYNQCGFGKAQGVVHIQEKLSAQRVLGRYWFCENEPVSVTYTVGGSVERTNRFSLYVVDTQTKAQQLLSETTNLTAITATSTGLKAGFYDALIVSSAPATTLTVGYALAVQAPVSASVVSQTLAAYVGDYVPVVVMGHVGAPFSLTLSDGQRGEVYSGYEVFNVRVDRSQSFSVARAANACGVAPVAGVVSISALSAAGVQLRVHDVYPLRSPQAPLCANVPVRGDWQQSGTFGANNVFTLLLSDEAGRTYKPIASSPTLSSLTALLPPVTVGGSNYRFRLASSSPAHEGATSEAFVISPAPSGTLTGTTSILKGDSTRLTVALTGTPPWQVIVWGFYGPELYRPTRSPLLITVRPDSTTSYRLFGLLDARCGEGVVSGTAVVSVSKLLSAEPALPTRIRTWPNPTSHTLTIEADGLTDADVDLTLHDAAGKLVLQTPVAAPNGRLQHRLDTSELPTGVYVLTIGQGGQRSQYKILRH